MGIIKSKYKNAVSKYFYVNKDKHEARRFEVDIYVPELRRGIEFNGNYWHSYDIIRSRRKNKSEYFIRNYHDIKKKALKEEHGIDIIYIWESEWLEDKEGCIKKCFDFLKNN